MHAKCSICIPSLQNLKILSNNLSIVAWCEKIDLLHKQLYLRLYPLVTTQSNVTYTILTGYANGINNCLIKTHANLFPEYRCVGAIAVYYLYMYV